MGFWCRKFFTVGALFLLLMSIERMIPQLPTDFYLFFRSMVSFSEFIISLVNKILIFSFCINCILRWNLAIAKTPFEFLPLILMGKIAYLFITCSLKPIFRTVIEITMVRIDNKFKNWRLKTFSSVIMIPAPVSRHSNFEKIEIGETNSKNVSINFLFFHNNILIITYFHLQKLKPVLMFLFEFIWESITMAIMAVPKNWLSFCVIGFVYWLIEKKCFRINIWKKWG